VYFLSTKDKWCDYNNKNNFISITNKTPNHNSYKTHQNNNELLERNMLHLLDAPVKDFQDTMYPASSPAEHAWKNLNQPMVVRRLECKKYKKIRRKDISCKELVLAKIKSKQVCLCRQQLHQGYWKNRHARANWKNHSWRPL
jgi:hypothetical protein